MVKIYDKVEILEEVRSSSGRPILKGSRGTILKANPDNTYTVEVKLHNSMMLRAYEFISLRLQENQFRVLEFKGSVRPLA